MSLRRISYLLPLVILAVISCEKVKVIPKDKMVAIYKEMYLADQWIKDVARQKTADTSYVYRPILNKYGYTEADFLRSVDYYTDKPKEFAGIFETVASQLRETKKVIDAKDKLAHKRDSVVRAREALPFRRADFVRLPEPDYYVAGLRVSVDTAVGAFLLEPVNIFEVAEEEKPEPEKTEENECEEDIQ
ncbi:MAG: DUF4296 domain-containing protein [Bacteroidales bacterium]|nr:DUF4296 domain-containing protein [Bacteroidales bacterium]